MTDSQLTRLLTKAITDSSFRADFLQDQNRILADFNLCPNEICALQELEPEEFEQACRKIFHNIQSNAAYFLSSPLLQL